MVSLVRSGPRSLLISTSRNEEITNYFTKELGAIIVEMKTIMKESEENHTIVYIVEYENQERTKYKRTQAFVVYEDPIVLISKMHKLICNNVIETLRSGPMFLIMRSTGDLNSVVNKVNEDFGGKVGSFEECSKNGFQNRTIISVTDKPLYKSMTSDDLHPKHIMLEEDYFKIKQGLRRHSKKYLNLGVGSKSWSDLEIRIYDSFGAYELHYKRLLSVLDSLQIGFVTGESWSKDQPRALLFIDVYSIRFLSFHSPEEIKKILFGLEYLEDGRRIVDYDLFQKNEKIQWSALYKGEKNVVKIDKAIEARKELYSRLSDSSKAELREYENEILKTRY